METPQPSIEERLANLESKTEEEWHTIKGFWTKLTSERADFMAVLSMLKEVCAQHGLSAEAFDEHYANRRAFFHDYLLRQAEDVSPELAVLLDDRSPEEVEESEPFPPLFDQQPPEES